MQMVNAGALLIGSMRIAHSVLQGPARPESRGLGPAREGLGLYFLRPEPKPGQARA
jgi:hypothetical protein